MSHNLNDEYELCSFPGICFDFDSYLIGKIVTGSELFYKRKN